VSAETVPIEISGGLAKENYSALEISRARRRARRRSGDVANFSCPTVLPRPGPAHCGKALLAALFRQSRSVATSLGLSHRSADTDFPKLLFGRASPRNPISYKQRILPVVSDPQSGPGS